MNAQTRVRELEKALDQCLAWAAKLQQRIAELEGSRTWRAQGAVAEAAGSVSKALGLPGKLSQILKGEEAKAFPQPLNPPWPADRPLLSIATQGRPFQLHSSMSPDCEVLPGGLEKARGRYYAFADDRTALSESWFESAIVALENNPSAALCHSAKLGPKAAPFELERLERFNPVPPGAVFRRELWEELGGFQAGHPEPERDFWLRAARAGHAGLMLGRGGGVSAARFAASGRFPHGEDFGAAKPCVLLILPWLAYGGAEQVALQLMEGLLDEFAFAVVAVEPDAHLRREAFEALTPWVYCLNELGVRDPSAFLAEFAKAHSIGAAIVSSTGAGYRALPALKELWRADIVHNVAPEGHLAASVEQDAEIATHFAVGGLQRRTLVTQGVASERIVTAANGVDARGRFDPSQWSARRAGLRAELGLEDGDYVFAYIGRLSPEKRPDRFVVAMSLLRAVFPDRRIRGVLAGDGPERLAVEQLIRDEGLRGEVQTLGFTERIAEILAASDAFVLPSDIEGSPLTLLEAMSMRLPCVAADVGAVAELVRDGETGLLVQGGEAGAFADAAARLLREPDLGPRLGEAARRLVSDEFDLGRTLAVYREAFLRELRPTIRE